MTAWEKFIKTGSVFDYLRYCGDMSAAPQNAVGSGTTISGDPVDEQFERDGDSHKTTANIGEG